jgi:hypothetical protein
MAIVRAPLIMLVRALAVGLSLGLGSMGCGGGSGGSSAGSPAGVTAVGSSTSGGATTNGGPISSSPAAPVVPPLSAASGTTLGMDFSLSTGFYAAPFPCESRRRADGSIDTDRFPNPRGNWFVDDLLRLARGSEVRGFGLTSPIFLGASGPLDPSRLPDLAASVDRTGSVFLVCVDPGSADYLRRTPVEVAYLPDPGPHGAADSLVLLPLQGIPLRPETLYAAVVMRELRDAAGNLLGVPQQLADVSRDVAPPGLSIAALAEYRRALSALVDDGVDLHQMAALAVFRTDQPLRGILRMQREVLSQPLPAPRAPWALVESHAGYHVYKTTIEMPVYQAGTPPFLAGGGEWAFDAQGDPILQGHETANLFVTVPRRVMPPQGFPACVLARTGLGGEKPLVDAGAHAVAHGPSIPGTGPAQELARAGWIGVSVDGPHGGLRNVTGADEQLLMFNVVNPGAMRDNVRQAALELVLVAELLGSLQLPGGAPGVTTPGGGPVRVDPARLALFGHSMGATISPLTLALQPRYGAAILSGAGGSWIENVVHKRSPVLVKPIAELVLDYPQHGYQLHEHDPVLGLLQWLGESADPPVYGRYVTSEPLAGDPRHVLMLQGIMDTYILPSIANATSLSMGLDLGGAELDRGDRRLLGFTPLGDLLRFSGAGRLSLPVAGNRTGPSGTYTAVVVQHPEDGIEDGHEVVFQTEAHKVRYREFLRTFAQGGAPEVP